MPPWRLICVKPHRRSHLEPGLGPPNCPLSYSSLDGATLRGPGGDTGCEDGWGRSGRGSGKQYLRVRPALGLAWARRRVVPHLR